MPFTLSHPAAVIPLARGRMVASALVIGSMAPDIPYFFFLMELRAVTHQPLGMVTVDLALGLLAYTVFHLLWKAPLIALAPDAPRRRLAAVSPGAGGAASPGWVVISLLAGIVTHVVWDGFTHLNHGFTGQLPWLVTLGFARLPLYRWLQYASGVAGLAAMAWWTLRWYGSAPAGPETAGMTVRARLWAGGGLVAGALTGGVLGGAALVDQPDIPRTFHMTVVSGTVGAITGGTLALTVYAIWWRAAGPGRVVAPASGRARGV